MHIFMQLQTPTILALQCNVLGKYYFLEWFFFHNLVIYNKCREGTSKETFEFIVIFSITILLPINVMFRYAFSVGITVEFKSSSCARLWMAMFIRNKQLSGKISSVQYPQFQNRCDLDSLACDFRMLTLNPWQWSNLLKT